MKKRSANAPSKMVRVIPALEFPKTQSLGLQKTVYPVPLVPVILQWILLFWTPCQASPSGQGLSMPSPQLSARTPSPEHTLCILVPIQSSPCHFLFFSPETQILCQVLWSNAREANAKGEMTGEVSFFEKQYLGGGLSGIPQHLKFLRLNERNTQLTKRSAAQDASSALAKSLLSFHPFFPNNSCPLIPCYSAVKNKTSLRLSVFLFFPRVGLITGD